ncbi:MAG: thiosulfate oxidation carrier complex protein SoxZ [Candidatus Competibacterales bacterium]
MSSSAIRLRAKAHGDRVEVKALMRHPMEPGTRRDEQTGELVLAHYIQEVTCQCNGVVVMRAHWGPAISQNPYFSFAFQGASPGDEVTLYWIDNRGHSARQSVLVS